MSTEKSNDHDGDGVDEGHHRRPIATRKPLPQPSPLGEFGQKRVYVHPRTILWRNTLSQCEEGTLPIHWRPCSSLIRSGGCLRFPRALSPSSNGRHGAPLG